MNAGERSVGPIDLRSANLDDLRQESPHPRAWQFGGSIPASQAQVGISYQITYVDPNGRVHLYLPISGSLKPYLSYIYSENYGSPYGFGGSTGAPGDGADLGSRGNVGGMDGAVIKLSIEIYGFFSAVTGKTFTLLIT
jgi:hypothetical protein